MRVGLGSDIHRLIEGRKFLLGGVEVPADKGEDAHSDGDVLLHAIIDALLGAAGAGDIGELFPDTDARWKDASSSDMLTAVWKKLSDDGWRIVNIDCIVSCQSPRVLPHRDKIRENIALLLSTDKERVFLKGKTKEGLDAVGRGEAVEALAVCLLETPLENPSAASSEKTDTAIETEENKSEAPPPKKNKLPKDFILTDDFQTAFELMETTDNSIFITGKAGTGKSTLIEYFKMHTKKMAIYLAPTGAAALNIGGKTIHSLFKFPLQVVTSDTIKDNSYKDEILELFKAVNIIIIDEISMARADLIEGIDYILKKFRDKDKPFGGVQMIFIGDMYQLPPVINAKESVKITYNGAEVYDGSLSEYFEKKYRGPYFFNSNAFKNGDFKYCVLNTIFRQKDDNQFLNILNAIREKNISNELLQQLNERYFENIEERNDEIILCTTNRQVDDINKIKMDELQTKPFSYSATVTGVFDAEIKKKDYPAEKDLILKENAQIMMIKNDKDGRWVNGAIGIIKKLSKNKIDVEINGSSFSVHQETWDAIDYEYDAANDKLLTNVIGTYTQYPVKLAWAITIHKSQGQTFEKVIIDLGRGAFAHGQTYVALSRCKTLNGIKLKRRIRRDDIKVDDKVVNFIRDTCACPVLK